MSSQIFGSLSILESRVRKYLRSDRPDQYRKVQFWFVQCSCGTDPFEISDRNLRNGSQVCKSCSHSGKNCSNFSHGESDGRVRGKRSSASSEYRCWKSIKTRCYNPKFKQYEDYGGRGIRVCKRWLDSFKNFLMDMGRKPDSSFSIQRVDNDGNYSPDNCCWGTDKEQRRNRRTTRWITINGRTQCRADWLEELGLSKSTFEWRERQGWTEKECLFGKN